MCVNAHISVTSELKMLCEEAETAYFEITQSSGTDLLKNLFGWALIVFDSKDKQTGL